MWSNLSKKKMKKGQSDEMFLVMGEAGDAPSPQRCSTRCQSCFPSFRQARRPSRPDRPNEHRLGPDPESA